MSILVRPGAKVLVQCIPGSFGTRHTQLPIDYGTQIVAGAFISGGKRAAAAKIAAFRDAGIGAAAMPSEMADQLLKMM